MDKNGKHRIVGEKKDISYEDVRKFFDERGSQEKKHLYNYVMYLDNNPEVAIERDRQGKEGIDKIIKIDSSMRVLDVRCGVGRWGEYFLDKGAYYVGIDGNNMMIERAENNLKQYNNKKLFLCSLQNIDELIEENKELSNFDFIFVSGVLMYLNDEDCLNVMKCFNKLCNRNSKICIIESMSNNERLTLDNFYSNDLNQDYSAIYRTVNEYKEIMEKAFSEKFNLKMEKLLDFEDGLQKRREHVTMEHCFIWEKKY